MKSQKAKHEVIFKLESPPLAAGRKLRIELVAVCGHPFTAQPKAPAFALAGACGWAVND
jgi:hypothetical protein